MIIVRHISPRRGWNNFQKNFDFDKKHWNDKICSHSKNIETISGNLLDFIIHFWNCKKRVRNSFFKDLQEWLFSDLISIIKKSFMKFIWIVFSAWIHEIFNFRTMLRIDLDNFKFNLCYSNDNIFERRDFSITFNRFLLRFLYLPKSFSFEISIKMRFIFWLCFQFIITLIHATLVNVFRRCHDNFKYIYLSDQIKMPQNQDESRFCFSKQTMNFNNRWKIMKLWNFCSLKISGSRHHQVTDAHY
jgi:hypothetical protein